MIGKRLARRRFIAVSAVLLGGMHRAACASMAPVRWQGVALGASASIELHVSDRAAGHALIARCVDEIHRLEHIFSLYQAHSAVSRLNQDGGLDMPPPELVELAARARAISMRSGGAFDVTVQPLWDLYARHYAVGADHGPDRVDARRAAAHVDYRRLRIEPRVIAFDAPDMALTFNGIAQGFITDRVSALLARAGLSHVLVDLGEVRALGPHPTGRPWRVGIRRAGSHRAGPGRAGTSGDIEATLPLSRGALATSAGAGTAFGANGRDHHLFDPHSGSSATGVERVTVRAPDATLADALSTAIACGPASAARHLVAGYTGVSATVVLRDARVLRL